MTTYLLLPSSVEAKFTTVWEGRASPLLLPRQHVRLMHFGEMPKSRIASLCLDLEGLEHLTCHCPIHEPNT